MSYINDLYWIAARVAMRLFDSNPKMARFVSDHGAGDGVALLVAGIRAEFEAPLGYMGITPRIVIPHSSIAMIVSASVVESLGRRSPTWWSGRRSYPMDFDH